VVNLCATAEMTTYLIGSRTVTCPMSNQRSSRPSRIALARIARVASAVQ
jgi:hypothetical protein